MHRKACSAHWLALATLLLAASAAAAGAQSRPPPRPTPAPAPGRAPVPAHEALSDTSTATFKSCPGTPAHSAVPESMDQVPRGLAVTAPCWLARCEVENAPGNPMKESYRSWCRCTTGTLVLLISQLTEEERDLLAQSFRKTLQELEQRPMIGKLLGSCRT